MSKEELLKYDWIKEKYEGVLEIYPKKCLNHVVLNKVLFELQEDYELIQVLNDWIRAFKR